MNEPNTPQAVGTTTRKFRFPGSVNTISQTGAALSEFRPGINLAFRWKDDEKTPRSVEVYSDDEREYADISLEWEGDTLTGYDGCFELPREVVTALIHDGFKMGDGMAGDEMDSEASATLPALARLFPTLARHADKAERESSSPRDFLTAVLMEQPGSGGTYAAQFIAAALDSNCPPFQISKALAYWDSEHRAAFRIAADRIARMF